MTEPTGRPWRLVNLGCGAHWREEWINFDIAPRGPGVTPCDLSRGIPLPDGSCDMVYHSAVLEHLRRPDAERFMHECFRVLRAGGTCRVGVPDLEDICRTYLSALERAKAGDQRAADDRGWMVLELVDQLAREKPGGEMAAALRAGPPNEGFILERIGEEGRVLLADSRTAKEPRGTAVAGAHAAPIRRVRARATAVRRWIRGGFVGRLRAGAVRLLLGAADSRALDIGRFRLSGEVHHWMYDSLSLAGLMAASGFVDCRRCAASESRFEDWTRLGLDALPDGTARKPDLLFMEARRP